MDKRTDFSLYDLAIYVIIFYFSKVMHDSKLERIFPPERVFNFLAFKSCEYDRYNKIRLTAYKIFVFITGCFLYFLRSFYLS